jgi:hypothetical protein
LLAWLAPALLVDGHARTESAPQADDHYAHDFCPHTVVDHLLQAVERGELVLYGEVLRKDMLTPLRVEYVHDLVSGDAILKVYVKLTKPFAIPGVDDFVIDGLDVIMDRDGNLVDNTAHAMPR